MVGALLSDMAFALVGRLKNWLATPERAGLLSAADKAWIDSQRAVPLLLPDRDLSDGYEEWSSAEGPVATVVSRSGAGSVVCGVYFGSGGVAPMYGDGGLLISFGAAPGVTRLELVSYAGGRPGPVLIECAATEDGPWATVATVDLYGDGLDLGAVAVPPSLRNARYWHFAFSAGDAGAMASLQMWGAV